MRFAPILLAVLMTIPFLPTDGATQTCSALERNVPAAGANVRVHTESCASVDVYGAWTYSSWNNLTSVTLSNLQGENVYVYDASAHYTATDGTQSYEQYGHSYYVIANDATSTTGAGASNYQYSDSYYGCQEYTSLGGFNYNSVSNTGIGETIFGGSNPPNVLPCSSAGTQQTLP